MSGMGGSSKTKKKPTTVTSILAENLLNSPYSQKLTSKTPAFVPVPSTNNIASIQHSRNGAPSHSILSHHHRSKSPNYRSPTFTSMNRKADVSNVFSRMKTRPQEQQEHSSSPGSLIGNQSGLISSSTARGKSKSISLDDSNEPFSRERIDLFSLIDPASPRNKARSKKRTTGSTKNPTTGSLIRTTNVSSGHISASDVPDEENGDTKKPVKRRKKLISSKGNIDTAKGRELLAAAEIEDLLGFPSPSRPTKTKLRRKKKDLKEQSHSERSITSASDRSKGGSVFNLTSDISSDNDDSFFFSSAESPKHEYPILKENNYQEANFDAIKYVQNALSAWAKHSRVNPSVQAQESFENERQENNNNNSRQEGPSSRSSSKSKISKSKIDQSTIKSEPQEQQQDDENEEDEEEEEKRTTHSRKHKYPENSNNKKNQVTTIQRKIVEEIETLSSSETPPVKKKGLSSRKKSPKKRPKTVNKEQNTIIQETIQEREQIEKHTETNSTLTCTATTDPLIPIIDSEKINGMKIEISKQNNEIEKFILEKLPSAEEEVIDFCNNNNYYNENKESIGVTYSSTNSAGTKSPSFCLDVNGNNQSNLGNTSCTVLTVETSCNNTPSIKQSIADLCRSQSQKCLFSVSIQTVTNGKQACVQTATSLTSMSAVQSSHSIDKMEDGTNCPGTPEISTKSKGVKKRSSSKRSKKSKSSLEHVKTSNDKASIIISQDNVENQNISKSKSKIESNVNKSNISLLSCYDDIPILYSTASVPKHNDYTKGGRKKDTEVAMELGVDYQNGNQHHHHQQQQQQQENFENKLVGSLSSSPNFGHNSISEEHSDGPLSLVTSSQILKDVKSEDTKSTKSYSFLDGQISTVGCSVRVSRSATNKESTDDENNNNNDGTQNKGANGDDYCDDLDDFIDLTTRHHLEQKYETASSHSVGVCGVAKTWSFTSYNHPLNLRNEQQMENEEENQLQSLQVQNQDEELKLGQLIVINPLPGYAASTQTIDETNAGCQVGHSLTRFDFIYEEEPQWFEGSMNVAEDIKDFIENDSILSKVPETLVKSINDLEFGDISSNIEKISDSISTTLSAITEIITEMVTDDEDTMSLTTTTMMGDGNGNILSNDYYNETIIPPAETTANVQTRNLVETMIQTSTVTTNDRVSSPLIPPFSPVDSNVGDGHVDNIEASIKKFAEMDSSLTNLDPEKKSGDKQKMEVDDDDDNDEDISLEVIAELLKEEEEQQKLNSLKTTSTEGSTATITDDNLPTSSAKIVITTNDSSSESLQSESKSCFRELNKMTNNILESKARLEQLVASI